MSDRLTTIRRRWADFPRLRYIGHKPTPAQVAGRTDGFDDVAEISTVDRYSTTMSWHDDATPALRDLLYRWSKAPEDVRWLVREVERLRGRVANLEAAALLLDEARDEMRLTLAAERCEPEGALTPEWEQDSHNWFCHGATVYPDPWLPKWWAQVNDGDATEHRTARDGMRWAQGRLDAANAKEDVNDD